jgi:hypothetical protein
MLNRTNLTQTALLNGLNLGTRSLVLGTSLNTNGKALTLRHSHHGFMRAGMSWYAVKPVMERIYGVPEIPVSFSVPRFSQDFLSRSASKRPRPQGCDKQPCLRVDISVGRLRDFADDVARRARLAAASAAAVGA